MTSPGSEVTKFAEGRNGDSTDRETLSNVKEECDKFGAGRFPRVASVRAKHTEVFAKMPKANSTATATRRKVMNLEINVDGIRESLCK